MHTINELAAACKGTVVGNGSTKVARLLTDSRRLFVPEETLFVALHGDRHDGARYVGDLYARGLRAFVCQKGFDTRAYSEATFIVVDDTLTALQDMAAWHRRGCQSKVVAVTGSNGKTIVKEWLGQLVEGDLRTVRSPRSYNSQVGVPLSLWNIEPDTQLSIIEAGVSERGEMQRLEKIVSPDDVIVTNIGPAHQENFASLEEKLEEKLVMCRNARRIFYCADQPLVSQVILRLYHDKELISWGKSPTATVHVETRNIDQKAQISLAFNGRTIVVATPLVDNVSVEDICHATVYALAAGIDANKLVNRAGRLAHIEMRLEQKEGHNNCTIIDDAYNADISSLEIALDMLHILGDRKGLSRTLILSDLQQTGLSESELYTRVGNLLKEKNVTRLIGIGQHIAHALMGTPNARFFASTTEFLSQMSTADFHDEAILLKGSRNFGFERITERLVQKRNRTVMEINLNALANNVAVYRSFLSPETKLLAMVKAYSYGTGSFEIAKLLQEQGVDYLGVAFADEGYELRVAGITLPIIVMNPEEHSFDLMLEYGLEPQIYSLDAIEKYSQAAHLMGIDKAGIHVKINTGMNRSGFRPHEMPNVAKAIKARTNIVVKSAFSHLVGSDEARFDDFTRQQISDFKSACAVLRDGLGYSFLRHILNSAGIERFSSDECEMVRLGIGLYGYGFSELDKGRLRNVCTLKSYISQIQTAESGESVGYSRKTMLTRPSRIAVVPIGYADGLSRRLSNGVGEVMIRGQRVPIAGNVCMDICMIDITDLDEAQIGDEVILFGDDNPVWEMSDRIGTIPYEVLTNIGRRVTRVYYLD